MRISEDALESDLFANSSPFAGLVLTFFLASLRDRGNARVVKSATESDIRVESLEFAYSHSEQSGPSSESAISRRGLCD